MSSPPPTGLFVTGTDTGCGKTQVTRLILRVLRSRGIHAAGVKPIASGCELTANGLRNQDALLLQAASGLDLTYEEVNPFAYAPAIAPHIAATQAQRPIDLPQIVAHCRRLAARHHGLVVEGVGGLLVPLDDHHTLADLILRLELPLVLVVGLRLGCLNHALLTAEVIQQRRLPVAGWIANQSEAEMDAREANLDSLRRRLPMPYLGYLPHGEHQPPPIELIDALTQFWQGLARR